MPTCASCGDDSPWHFFLSLFRCCGTSVNSKDLQEKQQVLWKAAIGAERARQLKRDLVRHTIFVAIFLAVIFMQRDVYESSTLNNSIRVALVDQQIDPALQPFPKTFLDIGQPEEFRDYLLGVLAPALTNSKSYSGRNLSTDERFFVQNENRIVGSVRFRQFRVGKQSCKLSRDFRDTENSNCFSPYYDGSTRSIDPFGPGNKFQYLENVGPAIFGYVEGSNYDAGGYVVDIPVDDNFLTAVQQLIADEFWDHQTRAVIITINVLNLNLKSRGAAIYLIAEFTAGGSVVTNYYSRIFRANLYIDNLDKFRGFLEACFALLLAYYLYAFIRELIVDYRIYGTLKHFFLDFWNWVEIANVGLFIATLCTYGAFAIIAKLTLNSVGEGSIFATPKYFVEWEDIGQLADVAYQIGAFNILLSCFKSFKYLRIHKRLYVLWNTLFKAGGDLVTFTIIFFIILLGFLFMGWLVFGIDLSSFNGFIAALGTCWQFLIGNPPDYEQLSGTNRILGPIFYALFTIFVFFVLVNMFVAIVGESYESIREEVKKDKENKRLMKLYEKKRATQKKTLQRTVTKGILHLKSSVTLRTSKDSKDKYLTETELLARIKDLSFMEQDTLPNDQEIFEILKANDLPMTKRYLKILKYLHRKARQFLFSDNADYRMDAHDYIYQQEFDDEGSTYGSHGSITLAKTESNTDSMNLELQQVATKDGSVQIILDNPNNAPSSNYGKPNSVVHHKKTMNGSQRPATQKDLQSLENMIRELQLQHAQLLELVKKQQ